MTPEFRSHLHALSRVVLVFGVLCYLTSCTMDMGIGGVSIEEQIPASGGTIGPFEVEDAQTVLEIDVHQDIERAGRTFKRWSFITVELLDANRNYQMGFGGEMWHEAGYDDGYWRESKDEYSMKVTVPEPGTYYFRFKTESDVSTASLSRISVDIAEELGSSLPFHVTAIFALIIGSVMWLASRMRSVNDLEASGASNFNSDFDSDFNSGFDDDFDDDLGSDFEDDF